jgi:N-acetylmuramic acid 6-phosphate etherase
LRFCPEPPLSVFAFQTVPFYLAARSPDALHEIGMVDYQKLIEQLSHLETEQVNPRTIDIDRLSAREIVGRINDEDRRVPEVVAGALDPIAQAAEIYAETLRAGGRIFYIGAGTSGRLGVLDAAECPPTFGSDPAQIVGVIAGGHPTLVLSREGVEDDREAAGRDLDAHNLSPRDFVIGIAASRRTPYTIAGVAHAKLHGCRTAMIICNSADGLEIAPDVVIALPVGPEAITGSTRMKSGTAQKLALNMISTTAMVLLGKTYGNLMVDLQAKSEKLAARSRKILMELLTITIDDANDLLKRSDGSVKLAIVMHVRSCDKTQAVKLLTESGGHLSRVI